MKTFFFFVPVLETCTPCRTTVRRHFVPRHFFRTGRLPLQINLPSALLHGGPFFRQNAKMDVKTFFFYTCFGDLYPCRTIVRRHFVPRHFFSGSPQKNRLCGVFYGILVIFLHFGILLCNIACINTVLCKSNTFSQWSYF